MTSMPTPSEPDDTMGASHDQAEPPATANDRHLWATTVETYLDPIYRYVRPRVPADAADDVVQDVFVSAAGSLGQFDPTRGSVWQWLVGIARNTIAQYYRRTRPTAPLAEGVAWLAAGDGQVQRAIMAESALPDEICQREEFRLLARAALGALEPRHRECLSARYFEDLSLAELGQRLNLSRSAVNSLLHRARRELREAFFSLIDEPIHTKECGQ